jgi:hypothetical protein
VQGIEFNYVAATAQSLMRRLGGKEHEDDVEIFSASWVKGMSRTEDFLCMW